MIESQDPEFLKLQQSQKDMLQRYKNVFGTAEGRKVLGDILITCHFGVPLMTEEARHEYNIGVAIARMSGVMSQVDQLLGMED